jgi:hypothetical protein
LCQVTRLAPEGCSALDPRALFAENALAFDTLSLDPGDELGGWHAEMQLADALASLVRRHYICVTSAFSYKHSHYRLGFPPMFSPNRESRSPERRQTPVELLCIKIGELFVDA